MKTEDMIQLGVLGLLAYLAWQKLAPAAKAPATVPTTSTTPATTPVDFGITNSDTWGDTTPAGGITFVGQMVSDVLG